MTPSITEEQVLTALRAFLLSVLPDGVEVILAQQNRVPQPKGPDFVTMTPTGRDFLSSSYRDVTTAGGVDVSRSTGIDMQLDVYGPASTDNAQTIATLFRDDYAFQFLQPYDVAPLWCDDGRQMPLLNGEQQYEARWMVQTRLQANPAISTPAEFAGSVAVNIARAD